MTINRVDNLEITEDDIRYAENILFDKVNIFDEEERIPIIKDFNESFDVNACPGSGKTTALLAKLIILSKKMPLKNGQGICVLTHTNVAIDEIKKKLGEKSDILFKYPNYFGTIQNFVDKYLAIPYYKRQTNEYIKSIDDDKYFDHIRKLSSLTYPKIMSFIEYCIERGYGNYTNRSFEANLVTLISNRHLDIYDDNIVIRDNNGNSLVDKFYYKELSELMLNRCLNKGILRYNDAYILAEKYIMKFPKLQSYFSSRFKYVFIDEMQDISRIQMDILEKIFDTEKIIMQRFGDVNQRIGQFEEDENNWSLCENCKTINSSKRYGEGIIKFLEPLRVVKKGNMTGNKNISTLNPYIIIYNYNSINKVIYKYFEILEKNDIKEYDSKQIKVIGKLAIQVENPYITIPSYVDGYIRKNDKKLPLNRKAVNKLSNFETIGDFYNYLIYIILLAIDKNDKRVSKDELLKLMKEEYNSEFMIYRSHVINWKKNFGIDTKQTLQDIVEKTEELFKGVKELNYNNEILKSKLISESFKESFEAELAATSVSDKFRIEANDTVDTIFGTKGETHLATLYLESRLVYDNGTDRSDISRILDYMVNKKSEVDDCDKEALMNAYVAMSRAEKLTCIAVQYDTIKGRIKEFIKYGYEVIACDDEIENLIKEEN